MEIDRMNHCFMGINVSKILSIIRRILLFRLQNIYLIQKLRNSIKKVENIRKNCSKMFDTNLNKIIINLQFNRKQGWKIPV